MVMIAGLHAHGEYSLLDGAGTAAQHVAAAKAAGYGALALTDHGTLAGALHHMRACREGGIMPIVGCELYFRPNRKVQGQKEWLKHYYHLTVLAKDERGWRNLMGLVSESHKTGFYGRACADLELLDRYHEGLICLWGCVGGQLNQAILKEDDHGAEAQARYLQRTFGDDLFAEFMGHDYDDLRIANPAGIEIADRLGIPKTITIDQHYPEESWAPVQDVLLMIATNQSLKKRQKKRDEGEDVYEFTRKTFFHQTSDQIIANFAEFHPYIRRDVVDDMLKNTLVCAGRTVPFLVDRSEKMPIVSFPGEESNAAYLRRLAHEGVAKRGYGGQEEYEKQVDYECDVFENLDSVNQMLMAWMVVDWCKSDRPIPKRVKGELVYDGPLKKPIMVGPGRGSAGGSTVSWAVGITNLNPRKHLTLFERFLNPQRTNKPDIDLDFAPDRVDEVEEFVKVVFGKDCVVDIIAHSTFGPRAALTDVGRVLNVPYEHVKAATKTIDDKEHGSLEEIALVNPSVKRIADEQPAMWDIACKVRGQVARRSEHAGGLLILPSRDGAGNKTKIENYIPVERQGGQKGKLLSSFGERSGKGNQLISDYGYNKLDVLRVAELTKQQHAVDLIYQRTGERIDLDALPVHDDPYACDQRVMEKFAQGQFVGVFQWSGVAGAITRKAKPKNIFDLSAINALIRPGPRGKGLDEQWVRRMRGDEEITYWHPKLEPFMSFSMGILAFQEQLIEVAHHLGGLSRAEADLMRRIASKYYRDPAYAREQMGSMFDQLKVGMMANGLTEEEVIQVLDTLISFSDYSFNLAHSDGYSLLAYRDMWLKTYYPREFYAAFLSKGLSQVTKKKIVQKQEAAREARLNGLKIMPPDINESGRDYTVVDGGIRLGLESIKNVGPKVAAALEEHRPFTSYDDIERRAPKQPVNITVKASLVMSGALDRWGSRDKFTEERIDELERELLGMSLSSVYSIAQYAQVIDGRFWTEDEVESVPDETRVAVAGEVAGVKEILDKKGNEMAFIDLAYGASHYSITVFSHLWSEFKDLVNSRRPLMITGEKNTHKNRISIVAKSLPADDSGEITPPIMDFQDYVEMIGDQEESFANDSVFPEDLAEEEEQEPVLA